MSAPQRIQRQRTKGWRMPEGAVYVGRPSKWGNPYVPVRIIGGEHRFGILQRGEPYAVLSGAPGADAYDDTLALCVAQYRWSILRWVEDEYGEEDEWVERALSDLTGHDLACWCPLDSPCHADVLLELANPQRREAS